MFLLIIRLKILKNFFLQVKKDMPMRDDIQKDNIVLMKNIHEAFPLSGVPKVGTPFSG